MDGVSAAASVIAVVQTSGLVFDLCRTYYLEVKDARKDIKLLRDEVTSLQDVLTTVADLAEDPGSATQSILSLLNQRDGPMKQCQKDLTGLAAKLDPGQGKHTMKQFGLRALKWPFSSKDVGRFITIIGRHKATFNLALTADHVGLARAIKDDLARLNDGVAGLKVGQSKFLIYDRRQKIHQWLSSPDPSSNHNAACKKRQPTTGTWFAGSDQFKEWKTTPNSFLWLHGIPGCGKTVLCSTIVQHVMVHCESDQTLAIIYFYFDFNDMKKRSHGNLIRSLIAQLSSQSSNANDELDIMYSRCQEGEEQPTTDALELTLQHMLGDVRQTFIILDALDECAEREELLGLIKRIAGWKLEKPHILVTSRRERDIEETLEQLITGQVCVQSALVNTDIQIHLRERLHNDPKLRKWPIKVRKEIEATLIDGAHGMFRWVVCQLDALRKCLKLDTLRRALKSLPKTLDDTYARILCNIDEEYSRDAFKVLQWLAYSCRPLRIEEVAEVIAVDVEGDPLFDPEKRLLESRDVLTICSSLVTTAASTIETHHGDTQAIQELRLAHFSVKEYLVSDRVRTGPASRYSIEKCADEYIAQTCLTYLLYFKGPRLLASKDIAGFPLARYAAQYWTQHAQAARKESNAILVQQLSMDLFSSEREAYLNCVRLFNPDKSFNPPDMAVAFERIAPPLYYASFTGLFDPVRQLLEKGADANAKGGHYSSALQAASVGGHDAIVQQLLESGADVNAKGGHYSNALQAASLGGHEAIVQQLLESGADVNAQGGNWGNALQAASYGGHSAIVERLLGSGANVNMKGGNYGSALQAASAQGRSSIVQKLLESGADVNSQGGNYGNALQAASRHGHNVIVQRLLESGSDINTIGGKYGNALQAASAHGHSAIVQRLLESGADVNAQGGGCGNALEAASRYGHCAIVQRLLESGADINAQGGSYGNALQAASLGGHDTIVQRLLESRPDVNAPGGYYGSVLQAASRHGHVMIVQRLLESGADINAMGGKYGNALQAASFGGHDTIVQRLLELGTDINTIGGKYGNALQAASFGGHDTIVQRLLESGANINALSGLYGNALQAASAGGHDTIIQLLLSAGAVQSK